VARLNTAGKHSVSTSKPFSVHSVGRLSGSDSDYCDYFHG
jgi:hypothetical protein